MMRKLAAILLIAVCVMLIFLPAKNRLSMFFEYKDLYGIEYGAGVG